MADTEKLSKNELKRRQKAEKLAAEKAEKERLKKEKAEKEGKKVVSKEVESTDPNEYFSLRKNFVNQQKEQGLNPYPHKFVVSISLTGYIEKYQNVKEGEIDKNQIECLSGRIHSKRESGTKLIFLDLRAEGTKYRLWLL